MSEAFLGQARAYCGFVERASALTMEERLVEARAQLLALYTAALALPDAPDSGADVDAKPATPEGWPGFGKHAFYWEVGDPYEEDTPVLGDLSGDVLETYREVKTGMMLWDRGHHDEAIWEWRFGFNTHWGAHAIDALRALHRAVAMS